MRTVIIFALLFVIGCSGKQQRAEEPMPNEDEPADSSMGPTPQEEVTFEAAGLTIHGVITWPDGYSDHVGPAEIPAIAIAAGSGPTDRDWQSPMLPGTNGSGRGLAEALASAGVAVLRYDKRGTGKTGMPEKPIVWGDYVEELDAAVGVLHQHEWVDKKRIYVAGHSEGGAHALRTAATTQTPLAGVILLAAAGRSLRDVVLWQIGEQVRAALNPAAAQAEIDALQAALDQIAAGTKVDPTAVGQLPGVQQFVMSLQDPRSVEFARGLLTYDPTTSFSAFTVPVLILSGDRDIQIDPVLDAEPLAKAAKEAGRDTTFEIVARCDHVLKHEERPREQLTAAVGLAYNASHRVMNSDVIRAIATWVQR